MALANHASDGRFQPKLHPMTEKKCTRRDRAWAVGGRGNRLILVFLLSLIPWLVAPVRGSERAAFAWEDPARACEDMSAYWPLWRALADDNGAHGQSRSKPLFPLTEIVAALRAVPLAKPLPVSFGGQMEYYRPRNYYAGDAWAQIEPYAKAAAVYEAGDLPEAIRQFDAIVEAGDPRTRSTANAPYRAAAAYTAARAAFRLGNFEEGAARIDRILADDDLSEFRAAAWMLIPRMRVATDAAPLAAAELAEMSRLLTLPTSVLCPETTTNESFGKRILDAAFSDRWFARPRGQDFISAGIDYAQADPVIAALVLMPNPLSFDEGGADTIWLREFGYMSQPWSAPWSPNPSDPARAEQVRERWRTSRNPLWALELAKLGTEQDLPALTDAIDVVRGWPDLTDRAKASLVWALAAYRARILLISGKPAEALAALGEPTQGERKVVTTDPPEMVRGALDSLVNGGARYFAVRHDLVPARRWAVAASTALQWPVAAPLKPILVNDLDELYRHPVLGIGPVDGAIALGPWRRLLDVWPSDRLIAFARRYDVAAEDRRAMVGAAWSRAFALRRWNDVFAWLPDLRAAFPVLGPDIDLIAGAWLPVNKRHLALRLALRAPGLVALPSWSRPPGGAEHWSAVGDVQRPADVLAFDPYNASDGNWWCSPEPAAVLDEDRDAILEPLESDVHAMARELGDRVPAAPANDVDWRAAKTARNEKLAADIPLLRDLDGRELKALATAGSATERLAEDAVEWGQHRGWLAGWFGSDEYLPETLHLAVRATRFGCRRPPDNSPWSRAAFKMLHERYPASEWAKRTPYWFGVLVNP
jgi:hypothetical protein